MATARGPNTNRDGFAPALALIGLLAGAALAAGAEAERPKSDSEKAFEARDAALRWLARHQKTDGSWDGEVPAVDGPTGRPASPSPQKELEIARLIGQLGDESCNIREAATRALIAGGEPVRAPVGKADGSPDPEVRERAGRILRELPSGLRERAALGATGSTALAVLAFLAADHTEKQGPFADNLRRAEAWLIKSQQENGSLGTGADHALAGLALAEAYGVGNRAALQGPAQKAADYSVRELQKQRSGWGQEPRGEPDLATTGWFVLQLKSAKIAGLRVDGSAFQGAMSFIDEVTGDYARAALRPGGPASPGMTAVGACCRLQLGAAPDDPLLAAAAECLEANPPGAPSDGELAYLYFAAQTMFGLGGERWNRWNGALRPALVNAQAGGGPLDGSDDDVAGSWTEQPGKGAAKSRVSATALGVLCLSIRGRYYPLR